jgi:hypothetical protein
MNEQQHESDLEALLDHWAQRRQSAKDLGPLRERIVRALAQERSPSSLVTPALASSRTRLGKFAQSRGVWFALGGAAALLVMCLSLFLKQAGQDADVSAPPGFAWLDKKELAQKARLLRETERLFENRLDWIAETDGRVLLEIQPNAGGGVAPSPTGLAVRVVVVRRNAEQPSWAPVWAVDLVVHQEQVVRLTSPSAHLPGGAELALWAYRVDKDLVAVDANLSLAGPALQSTFSGLQHVGVPTPVCVIERDGTEFRIFQTVAVLDSEA